MARPKQPLIERKAVIAAALAIVDAEGPAALSIRRLGKELGVNGVSLYHHFKDKDEILDEVAAHVLGSMRVVSEPVTDWRRYLLDAHAAYRRAVALHPNTASILLERRPRRFGTAVYDQGVRVLVEAGVPSEYAWTIIEHLEAMAIGSALLAMPIRKLDDQFGTLGRDASALRKALADAKRLDEEESYDLGAQLLVEGIEQRFMTGRRATAPTKQSGTSAPRARTRSARRPAP